MQIRAYGATDVGKVRSANEDSFLIDNELLLYVVADGMGGHQGGGFASQHAVAWLREELIRLEQAQETTTPVADYTDRTPTQVRLLHALKIANDRLFKKASQDPSLRGMGTTVSGIQFDHTYANLAHVGDSRIYRLRNGQITQLSRDHSWVQEQIDAGLLSEEEAHSHPLKNIITRSMGHEPDIKVDLGKDKYQPGDKFLLCSDGLSNLVPDQILLQVVSSLELEAAVNELIRLSLEAGGQDNTTAVLVEVLA